MWSCLREACLQTLKTGFNHYRTSPFILVSMFVGWYRTQQITWSIGWFDWLKLYWSSFTSSFQLNFCNDVKNSSILFPWRSILVSGSSLGDCLDVQSHLCSRLHTQYNQECQQIANSPPELPPALHSSVQLASEKGASNGLLVFLSSITILFCTKLLSMMLLLHVITGCSPTLCTCGCFFCSWTCLVLS